MKEECLICKAPLEYLEVDELMECAICHLRDSYLSILSAIDFVKEHFAVEMEKPIVVCEHSQQNNQCIGNRSPFYKKQ